MNDSAREPSPAPGNRRVRIVTVAREFGSGGSELARAIGARLGWSVLEDAEVVRRVARRLDAPEHEVEARDEHVATLAERMGTSLALAFPEMVLPPEPPRVDEGQVAATAFDVLRDAAEDPPGVVVGHGGMCLFAERDDALHLRVVAPREHRVRAVAERLGMSREAAEEELRARDADRASWVQRHFGVRWNDATLYALVLNSERVPAEEGAALVERLIRG